MAEIWRPKEIKVYQQWIEDILEEAEEELSDWERNYIDSINMRLQSGRSLTEAQEKVLERIYSEKTE